ncbi:MAG: hypothetical protein QME42_06730 [bacterium]|nr:hypothetical protein [bacterium]
MANPAILHKQEEIIPPYYDRYLDEREKRFVTEIGNMRSDIRLNTQRLDNRIDDLKEYVVLRFDETNKRIDETNKRIDDLKEYVILRFDETNKRIDETNKRIDETNKRIDGLDKSLNARIDETNKRIDNLRDSLSKKIDHHFYWTIALFAPLILSVIAGMITILFRGN